MATVWDVSVIAQLSKEIRARINDGKESIAVVSTSTPGAQAR